MEFVLNDVCVRVCALCNAHSFKLTFPYAVEY